MVASSDINQVPFSPKKFALLGIFSMLLSFTKVMSLFIPFPMALATQLYGRVKGYALMGGCWLICLVASIAIFKDPSIIVLYSFGIVFAVCIVEMFERNIAPMKGVFAVGTSIVIFLSLLFSLGLSSAGQTVEQFIIEQIDNNKQEIELQKDQLKQSNNKEALSILAVLDDPKALSDVIVRQAPSYVIMSIFIGLWLNVFLLLRAISVLPSRSYGYGLSDMLHFKMPDLFIWPVIVALLLALSGSFMELDSDWYEVIGVSALRVFGVFYFFQGVGIYLSFLDALKIKGFFRTVLVVFTLMMAYWMLAVIGLFDMFVNFRKLFNKMNRKGE